MTLPLIKIRGFEVAEGFEDKGIQLPEQATAHSAGYDFFIIDDLEVPIFNAAAPKPVLVPTGVKAYMKGGEVLQIFARSSLSKLGLQLANCTGIIDADYYGNPDNDGHIMFAIWNFSSTPVALKKGDRIGQGLFIPYFQADGSKSKNKRTGGFGSSDKKA
jgi:dUTP pyrophosphatase